MVRLSQERGGCRTLGLYSSLTVWARSVDPGLASPAVIDETNLPEVNLRRLARASSLLLVRESGPLSSRPVGRFDRLDTGRCPCGEPARNYAGRANVAALVEYAAWVLSGMNMMTRPTIRRLLCASLGAVLLTPASLVAQDDVPVGQAAPEPVIAQEPQTPEELFEAMLLMIRISRPDLAKAYLQQFLATDPDDALLQELRDQHGSATYLRLSRTAALQPESQDLLQRLQAAGARTLSDPAFFDGLIAQLEGPPRDRESAITALKQYGADAVPGLLDRLGRGDLIEQHNLLLIVLTRLGHVAVDPLLGAVEAPNERIRALSIEALGWLGGEQIVPHLWYPAFGSDQPPTVQSAARRAIARIRYGDADRTDRVTFDGVTQEIRDRALQHFSGEYSWTPDAGGQTVVWSWDTTADVLVKTPSTPQRASAFLAQRLSREAMLTSPDDEAGRALFLAASLAVTGYQAGWDQPWPVGPGTAHNLAMFSGADLTEQALHLAVEYTNGAAAVGALKALGQIASQAILRDRDGRESAVIAAIDYPHDRVQFAAASCILQTDPQQGFTKGHRVVEILSRALTGGGAEATVVIDPNVDRGATVAAELRALGYKTSLAATGREGFRTAAERGDVALAVIHPNTVRWELTHTVANFRADSRTAGIPIAVYGPQTLEHKIRRLIERTEDSEFIVVGGDSAYWQRQLAGLVHAVDVPPLTLEQQNQRVQIAAYWLRRIAETDQTDTYDLTIAEDALLQAVGTPLAAGDALVALGAVPRGSAQKRFAEIASSPALSAEIREAAAWELAGHVRRYGRLLTDADVNELKTVWRDGADARIHTALTSVLGALGATPEAVGASLQSHTLPPRP